MPGSMEAAGEAAKEIDDLSIPIRIEDLSLDGNDNDPTELSEEGIPERAARRTTFPCGSRPQGATHRQGHAH
jgi:hypothetical protein